MVTLICASPMGQKDVTRNPSRLNSQNSSPLQKAKASVKSLAKGILKKKEDPLAPTGSLSGAVIGSETIMTMTPEEKKRLRMQARAILELMSDSSILGLQNLLKQLQLADLVGQEQLDVALPLHLKTQTSLDDEVLHLRVHFLY